MSGLGLKSPRCARSEHGAAVGGPPGGRRQALPAAGQRRGRSAGPTREVANGRGVRASVGGRPKPARHHCAERAADGLHHHRPGHRRYAVSHASMPVAHAFDHAATLHFRALSHTLVVALHPMDHQ